LRDEHDGGAAISARGGGRAWGARGASKRWHLEIGERGF
jgi:hypothetical protein